MTAADKLTKLISQLVGDISRLPGVTLDSAGEAQLGQLLADAAEDIGLLALDEFEQVNRPAQPIRMGTRPDGQDTYTTDG